MVGIVDQVSAITINTFFLILALGPPAYFLASL